jgi:hypothetical protein
VAALAAATTLTVDHFYKFHSPKKRAMASLLAPQGYTGAQLKGKSLISLCHISFKIIVTNPQARWSLAVAENLLKYMNNAQKSGDSRRLLTAPVWLQTAEMAPAAFTSTFLFIIPSPMDSFTALGGLWGRVRLAWIFWAAFWARFPTFCNRFCIIPAQHLILNAFQRTFLIKHI